MEDNTELEEGEAYYYNDNYENINPDIDLSYIDEKIQSVLGHFQKEFEGGVFAENLGAKYGGYGSFLPTYGRSPSVSSHPQTPQKSQGIPMEVAPENSTVFTSATPTARLEIVSSTHQPSNHSRIPPVDVSVKKDSHFSSAQIAQNCSSKDDILNRTRTLTDHRPLKVRIKMSSGNIAKKNAIYSGLGLDDSPSSTLGESPEESGGVAPISQVIVNEYPTNILQVMTSFFLPENVLISPLHDDLLGLIKEEKHHKASKVEHSPKGVQDYDGSVSQQGGRKLLKDSKRKLAGKSKKWSELKNKRSSLFESDLAIPKERTLEMENPEDKEYMSNDLNCRPLSNSLVDSNQAFEVYRNSMNNELEGRTISPELAKEEPLESVFREDHGKNNKWISRSRWVEKDLEQRAKYLPKNLAVDYRDDNMCNGNKISVISDAHCDMSKCKDLDLRKLNIIQKNLFHEQVETTVPSKKEKSSSGGKNKSKQILINAKTASVSTDGLKVEMAAVLKEKQSTSSADGPCINRSEKLKDHKNDKVRDDNAEVLWGNDLEQAGNVLDPIKKLSGERSKDVKIGKIEVDRKSVLDKPKETPSSYGQLMSEPFVKDASDADPRIVENILSLQILREAEAPVFIEEDWVQCDICKKWRLLPFGRKPEDLPQIWSCNMLNWLNGMNRCDISQEGTTDAVRALYQLPLPDSQNNLQNQANGSSSGVTSVHPGHLDKNYQNHNSHDESDRVAKRHGLKKLSNVSSISSPCLISIPTESSIHEPARNRGLNDMNQPPVEKKLAKKSKPQHMSRSDNLVMGKKMSRKNEKHVKGGDAKEMKSIKREADQFAGGISKKPKIEVVYNSIKHQNSDVDVRKVAPSSSIGLPTKACGKDNRFSKDTKRETNDMLQISLKKVELQSWVSSDGGAFDVKMCNGREYSTKKRELKDLQDSQSHVDLQNAVNYGKVDREESKESGFKKENDIRISKPEQELNAKDDNDKSNRNGRVAQIILTSNKSHQVDGMIKDGSGNKEDQSRKQIKTRASQQTIDGQYLVRKDLGSRRFSTAANSSSSKVSSSHKILVNFEEVKGSPVESVSSSPLRTSNLDKSLGNNNLRKEDSEVGVLPSVTNGNVNQFGPKRKEKVLSEVRPDSHKLSNLDYQDGDDYSEFSIKNEPSFEVQNSHLVNGDFTVAGYHPGVLHGKKRCYDADRPINNHHTAGEKLSKVSSLQSKEEDRSSTFDLDRYRTKVSDPLSRYSKKSQKYNSDPERVPNVKHGSAKRCSTRCMKDEKNHIVLMDLAEHKSRDLVMKAEEEENEHDGSGVNLGARYSSNVKFTPQQNLNSPVVFESRSKKSKLFSHSKSEEKREIVSLCCQPVPGSGRADTLHGLPGDASVSAGSKSKYSLNIKCLSLDHKGARRGNASSPSRNFFDLVVANALKEAKALRDRADHLKSSRLAFESSDIYFLAALKFLHGAALLEACSGESGKHGEMNQMQAYLTTAKLCKICTHEYEEHQEMASAALAYKCMEVAYMRLVYCKHSSTIRYRHELQASLNMAPQGESPSSSASDIDNLNIQVTMERATLSKGSATHIAGNYVLVAPNRPNFVRLLDFAQDVNLAMEASRKSQIAFTAAGVTLREAQKSDCVAQKSDCIASIKRVIDFSFQDIEELIRLVRDAMKTISSVFGGARY